ncbi:MAG: oligosaccharide flippase family protein [Longimicrobiaceae bacterium]
MTAPEVASGQELRERALGGVVAVALRSLVIRGMSLAANIVLARQLTPDDFGLMAFGLSIVAIGAFFTSGGFGAALIRQPEPPTRMQLQAVFGTQLLVATLVATTVLAIGAPLGTAGLLAGIMAFCLPLDVLRVPSAILSERRLHFTPVVRAEVGEMLAYNVVAVVLVLAGAGIWSVGVAVLVRAAVGSALLIAAAQVGLMRPRLSFPTIKPLLRFGLTLQSTDLVAMARGQGLNFLTAGVGGVAVLGQWSFSLRLLQPIMLLFDAVSRVAFPAVSGLLRAGEDPRPILEKGIRLAYGATGLGVVALAAATPALVPSLFGEAWRPAIAVIPWSLAGLMLSSPLVACAGSYLNATGEAGVVLRSTIFYSLAWFAVSLPLLPLLGPRALAIGWTVAGAVDAAYLIRALRSRVPARVVSNALPPVVLAFGVAPVGWLIEDHFGATLPTAALAAAVAAVGYTALLWLVRPETVREIGRLGRRLTLRRA